MYSVVRELGCSEKLENTVSVRQDEMQLEGELRVGSNRKPQKDLQ